MPGRAVCEIVSHEDAFLRLRPDWDALWARADSPYASQGYAWCWAGWQTTGRPRGRDLCIIVMREDDRVVLIWPLALRTSGLWRIAAPLGSESTEYDPILVERGPEAPGRIAAAWSCLQRRSGADICVFPFVRAGSATAEALAGQSARASVETLPAPAVSWEGLPTWDDYWRTLSANLRSGVTRRRRRLSEQGPLEMVLIEDPAEFEALVDWTLRLKLAWVSAKDLANDFLSPPEFRRFLIAAAGAPSSTGRLVMFALKVGDRTIATKIGAVDNTRYEGFITAHDPEYAKLSPGQIILKRCLRWCHDRGLAYDFRIGEEAYKRDWANRTVMVATHMVAVNVRGEAWLALRAWRERLRVEKDRMRTRIPADFRRSVKAAVLRAFGLGTRRAP